MNEATLASVYSLDLADGITRTQFLELCPALIQQKVGGHCDPLPTTTSVPVPEPEASQLEGNLTMHNKPSFMLNSLSSDCAKSKEMIISLTIWGDNSYSLIHYCHRIPV